MSNAANRDPIPVGKIFFGGSTPIALPGATSVTSMTNRLNAHNSKSSKHEIDYLPWMRSFRVMYFDRSAPPVTAFVPESRVDSWHEFVPMEAPPEPKTAPKANAPKSKAAQAEQ